MELHVVGTEGIPDGCVLSVRAGSTRRQAPVSADRPFRFPTSTSEALPFKVDVLEPVATARLILRPGEERRTDCQYTIPLESAAAAAAEGFDDTKLANAAVEAAAEQAEMSVTIAVRPTNDEAESGAGAKKSDTVGATGNADAEGGDANRPDSSKGKRATNGSSASSRHGQASAAREYLDQHNLVEFTQLLVQSVIKEQPDRPYAFMARQFYFPDPKPRPNTCGADAGGNIAASGAAGASTTQQAAAPGVVNGAASTGVI